MKHSLIVSRNRDTITFLRERYLADDWAITDDPDVAIAMLEREPFDRIFLDHWLGKDPKNGRDVSIYLGQHPECNPTVQVIAMTTDTDKARQMIAESGRATYHIPSSVIVALGT